jgi:hypothetical protein
MEPIGKEEPNASMAIVATYTTACLLDESDYPSEPPAQQEPRKRGVKARLLAGASDLLRRGGKDK